VTGEAISSVELSAVIAAAMAHAGADTVFGIPGGGNNLDLIGALESAGLRFVLAHAETPAAMMAAVYADLTGNPAGCVVTRGPGAASAVNGVANAMLDRQQLVMFTDVVSSADHDRIPHQRLDQRALFRPVTKWSATVGTGDAAATMSHAVATTMSHPRGPVHLDLDPTDGSTPPPPPTPPSVDDEQALSRLTELLASARRPVVLLGVGARQVVEPVRALLRTTSAPALTTYRAKGAVPDSWPSAAGLLTGATTEAPLLEAADLIVLVGVDAVELIPGPWAYAAPVVSVAAWPETSSYLTPAVEVVGDLEALVGHLAKHWPETDWQADAGNRHRDGELARLVSAGPDVTDGLAPQVVVERARAAAPPGSIATVDAGAHMLPAMSLWPVEEVDEALISSGLATMGYAVPAAIGASLARPGRRVVCFTGDGGLAMSLGELETIVRLDLPITIVVFNDSRLSLIAIKARPSGHGGEGATSYRDVDFATVAAGYGMPSHRAATADELDAALASALTCHGPTLVDVRVDPSGYPQILAAVRGRRDQVPT
jgi:acetolactate synthase I/II/III large subunit